MCRVGHRSPIRVVGRYKPGAQAARGQHRMASLVRASSLQHCGGDSATRRSDPRDHHRVRTPPVRRSQQLHNKQPKRAPSSHLNARLSLCKRQMFRAGIQSVLFRRNCITTVGHAGICSPHERGNWPGVSYLPQYGECTDRSPLQAAPGDGANETATTARSLHSVRL